MKLAAALLALGACSHPAPTKVNATEGSSMSGSGAAVSPAGDKHPGEIVYDDKVQPKTWTKRADEVPVEIAWVKVGDAYKPVVRIEITGAGDTREITKFGPNHEFLETTRANLGSPAPNAPPPDPVPQLTPAPEPK